MNITTSLVVLDSMYPLRELSRTLAAHKSPRSDDAFERLGRELLGSYGAYPTKIAWIKTPSLSLLINVLSFASAAGIYSRVVLPGGRELTLVPVDSESPSAQEARSHIVNALFR